MDIVQQVTQLEQQIALLEKLLTKKDTTATIADKTRKIISLKQQEIAALKSGTASNVSNPPSTKSTPPPQPPTATAPPPPPPQPTATASSQQPFQSQPQPPADPNKLLQSITTTLLGIMNANSGTGIDSPEVVAIIQQYLRDDKVKLQELDNSVVEFIKKNQSVSLFIPALGKTLLVNKATSQIPNFYDIIDDVLAGINVYLIGEAGGGKTYTAEMVAKALQREYVTLNCSQYTSPLEILGGQSVEGFKKGKLIDCWEFGKILILDEMPKLDANTAGLFNDALAKSTKTKPKEDARINSANPEQAPIERNADFGLIATGNIYPNMRPPEQYRGNNQQDLSLLDRFSGSVYYTEFDMNTDMISTRYSFLYKFLVGNYYEYLADKAAKKALPEPVGLRTVIEATENKNLALVSYRTNTAFRVAFEYELVREIAVRSGKPIMQGVGKTLLKTFKSYMVAFRESPDAAQRIMDKTKYTDSYIQAMVADAIDDILSGGIKLKNSLNPNLQDLFMDAFKTADDFIVGNVEIAPDIKPK